jgi:hypothetical protein
MLEILRSLGPYVGGGLAAAIVTILYARKMSRLQNILLVQRVNQLVTADLGGITLARRVGGYHSDSEQLEPVNNVREYQLSLRNTSNLYLRDVEIQFEFNVEDVLARTQRPVLSRTPLVPVEAVPGEPWKRAFRWKIPSFPVGDSVEFTFQTVEAPSGNYEAFLYNADRAILKRNWGEPVSKAETLSWFLRPFTFGCLAILVLYLVIRPSLSPLSPNASVELKAPDYSRSKIAKNGCVLTISSEYEAFKSDTGLVFQVQQRIFNDGDQDCTVQTPKGETAIIKARDYQTWNTTATEQPKLVDKKILIGADRSNLKAVSVPLF